MSQEDIAFKLNVSRNSYAKMERNITDVSYSRLVELSKVLEVHICDLVSSPQDRYPINSDNKDETIANLQKTIMELIAKMDQKRPRRNK